MTTACQNEKIPLKQGLCQLFGMRSSLAWLIPVKRFTADKTIQTPKTRCMYYLMLVVSFYCFLTDIRVSDHVQKQNVFMGLCVMMSALHQITCLLDQSTFVYFGSDLLLFFGHGSIFLFITIVACLISSVGSFFCLHLKFEILSEIFKIRQLSH